jgi:hypothetical protein
MRWRSIGAFQPPSNASFGLPTAFQPPFQPRFQPTSNTLPTPFHPTPHTPQALEAAFSGAFGPLGCSPRRGKMSSFDLHKNSDVRLISHSSIGDGCDP